MQVIPVIDVRHGVAVRAVAGDRTAYRPLVTPLASDADPVSVARRYLALYPFQALYLADLDGIEGRGANADLPKRLQVATNADIWLDDGSSSCPLSGPIKHVLGSESLADGIARDGRCARDWVLSLDFRDADFAGPARVLEDADLWPDRIIVMTLARVGMNEGPDFARLKSILARAGPRAVYAAGGIRHRDDLAALHDIGVVGALVASALHSGQITTRDLEEIGA